MSYPRVIEFLAQNPWVLAFGALITFWPVIAFSFKTYRKLDSWVVSKISLDDTVAIKCSKDIKYYLSIIVIQFAYILLLFLINRLSFALLHIVEDGDKLAYSIARGVLGALGIASAIFLGIAASALISLALKVKWILEAEDPG